jgi:hypothetical protein
MTGGVGPLEFREHMVKLVSWALEITASKTGDSEIAEFRG